MIMIHGDSIVRILLWILLRILTIILMHTFQSMKGRYIIIILMMMIHGGRPGHDRGVSYRLLDQW